jgi:hypothetical protein
MISEKLTQILDVGCGCSPKGTVNCDLFILDYINHRDSKKFPAEYKIDAKKVPNFVLCDANHLPFVDSTFESVYSRYLLEHVPEPFKLLCEFVRCSINKVVVEVPHRRGQAFARGDKEAIKQRIHVSWFDMKWFARAGQVLHCTCECQEIVSMILPHPYLPWIKLPQVIRATLTKSN